MRFINVAVLSAISAAAMAGCSDNSGGQSKTSKSESQNVSQNSTKPEDPAEKFAFYMLSNFEDFSTMAKNLETLSMCGGKGEKCLALYCAGWASENHINTGSGLTSFSIETYGRGKIDGLGFVRSDGDALIKFGKQIGKLDAKALQYNPRGADIKMMDWYSGCLTRLMNI